MTAAQEYVLGQSERAAHRLAIQDAHFAEVSERLLDDVGVRPADRVVELGCGPGGFSKRILARLGSEGVLVGVDSSQGLLEQAQAALQGIGAGRFEPVLADISIPGAWLEGADVVVARTVLHHVPMVEFLLGKLRTLLRAGTRVGFIEPDFRTPLGHLGYLVASGRPELAPLCQWGVAINQLYQARRLSPAVSVSLARTLEEAGYRQVADHWLACRSDALMIENMLMFYDEVRQPLADLGILSLEQNAEEQRLLRALSPDALPPVWALHRVHCIV